MKFFLNLFEERNEGLFWILSFKKVVDIVNDIDNIIWFAGIEFLRKELHLPPEIVPATLRRQPKPDTARARPRGIHFTLLILIYIGRL